MRFVKGWLANPKTKHFKPILLILFVGSILMLSFYFAVPETPPCSICVNSSKISQGFYAVLLAFVDAGCLALAIWWLKNIRVIHFNKYEEDIK